MLNGILYLPFCMKQLWIVSVHFPFSCLPPWFLNQQLYHPDSICLRHFLILIICTWVIKGFFFLQLGGAQHLQDHHHQFCLCFVCFIWCLVDWRTNPSFAYLSPSSLNPLQNPSCSASPSKNTNSWNTLTLPGSWL